MVLMNRFALVVVGAACTPLGLQLGAQSLARRVANVDGTAQILFASRPGACGDGQSFIGRLMGTDMGGRMTTSSEQWSGRACEPGPVRVVATVAGGEVTRLRMYIGPVPLPDARIVDLGLVPAAEAVTWLAALVANAPARVATEAIQPLVAADGSEPWPQLLAVARDDARPRDTRHQAMFWLGQAVTHRLGLDNSARNDDDEVKEQAVFALSQQPRDVAVPKLIELARASKNEPVRGQAIFWLGQSGDARATALFAELLGLR